jgi:choline dehydrogenase-like flavoprotein
VKGLRVVDASVFPAFTNPDPNPIVLLVAEKAARKILATWKLK